MIYINRGLLVTPYELRSNPHEINSLTELIVELITGQSNGIDEDGDSQETHDTARTVQPDITNQFSQLLELWNKFPVKTERLFFPTNETLQHQLVYGQIDHPPEILSFQWWYVPVYIAYCVPYGTLKYDLNPVFYQNNVPILGQMVADPFEALM